MLNLPQHDLVIKKLLINIFQDPILNTELAFKGGTCLYLFHNLNRFSTDLDFNLISNNLDYKAIEKIIRGLGLKITDKMNKLNTWFWAVSYGAYTVKIKIEISKRDYPDTYEIKQFLGTSIRCMTKDCMLAHKLCAISDRKIMQNRDLYDALFMFKNNYPISILTKEIIKIRTKKDFKEYMIYLDSYVSKNINPTKILDGLGEVLDGKQKAYYKSNLLKDLLLEIKIRS